MLIAIEIRITEKCLKSQDHIHRSYSQDHVHHIHSHVKAFLKRI